MNVVRASVDVLSSVITLLDRTLVAVTLATLLAVIITLVKVRLLIVLYTVHVL
jgi:hypothetical protein